jgi:hypothetical protein
MKKLIGILPLFAILFFGLFLTATQARANPIDVSEVSDVNNTLIIGVGIIIAIVVLVSWLVIRAIRRKKNVINK